MPAILMQTPEKKIAFSKQFSCYVKKIYIIQLQVLIVSHTIDQSPNYSAMLPQGSKKPPSGPPGQVHFPFGQVTSSPYLPHGQGPRQVVRRLNC